VKITCASEAPAAFARFVLAVGAGPVSYAHRRRVPTENLILYDERGRPMRPVSTVPDLPFFAAGTMRDFSAIAKDSLSAHSRDAR
jgi:hypothetical protein